MRITVGDVEFSGPLSGSFINDIACADQFGVRTLGEMGKIDTGNTAAADNPDPDLSAGLHRLQ
jgi:hypothetical protein